MCRAIRTIEKWCPARAIGEQFADWSIELVEGMWVVERFLPNAKTCLIDRAEYLRHPSLMLAHIWAHLTLHLPTMGGPISEAQENEADDLVDWMLDEPETRDARFWDLRRGPILVPPADEDAA